MILERILQAITTFRKENGFPPSKILLGKNEVEDLSCLDYSPNFRDTPEGRKASQEWTFEKHKENLRKMWAEPFGLTLVKMDRESFLKVI